MKYILHSASVLAFISLLIRASLAAEYTVEPWSSGILANEPAAASALIRSGEELEKAKEALGIADPLPGADFGKHALLLIMPVEGTGGIIEIAGVTPAAGGALEVRYRVRSEGPRPEGPVKASYPYLILKLSPAPGADLPVRLIDEDYVNTLSSGTGLGQFREYTNVLSAPEDAAIAEYLPIDKGNTWTYKSETSRGSSEVTNSVVSESDGWSVFDTFFEVPGVGMKISPGGDILVSSKGGIKTFYNTDAVIEFPKEPYGTPAGVFDGVMVVTVPEGGDFWFRDVYAKGVGLVSHEQKSEKGRASYMLIGARVGGAGYPRASDSRSTGKD
jgi:hypothetical protein